MLAHMGGGVLYSKQFVRRTTFAQRLPLIGHMYWKRVVAIIHSSDEGFILGYLT